MMSDYCIRGHSDGFSEVDSRIVGRHGELVIAITLIMATGCLVSSVRILVAMAHD